MRVAPELASSLARLLAWDAPFLPEVRSVSRIGDGVDIVLAAEGIPVREAAALPRARRLAVAVQVLAAAEFLFDRGWFAGRALLAGARVQREDGGDRLRLAVLPLRRLDDPRLERRLRARPALGENALASALAPLLRALAPERWPALAEVLRRPQPWLLGEGLLGALTGDGRMAGALRHPGGTGRALWARQFLLPASGVCWVEDDAVLPAAAAAARLAAAGGTGASVVLAGALEEEEVARALARAAADGNDALVLTSLPLRDATPLAAGGGEAGVWVLAVDPSLGLEHARHAVELAAGRAPLLGEALRLGAAAGFSAPPVREIPSRRVEQLASPPARRALNWLAHAPVGLAEDELRLLEGAAAGEALQELDRLRLVARRGGRWYALATGAAADGDRLTTLAARLPERSWAGSAARGITTGDWAPARARCEEELAAGRFADVLAIARALHAPAALALAGAEAALALGRLADAERFLDGVPEGDRDDRWRALAAWWAEQAGLPARAAAELARLDGRDLPDRHAARASLVAAELARRQGDHGAELRHLRAAVERSPAMFTEARLLLAMAESPRALARLRRAEGRGWSADVRARALHLVGYAAMSRGALAAAGTAMRAALRTASGANPLLLGDVHSDLGTIAILADQAAVAERHLRLAERFLEHAGSRRAVTVVRANRGVLATDRLDWRLARSLVLASRELRGGVIDSAYWFEEIELARAELARGDAAAVRAALPALEAGLAPHTEHTVLQEALAALKGQLALIGGDLGAAAASAAAADAGERELIMAVVRADQGREPAPSLPARWGIGVTARALARWRGGDHDGARGEVASALARIPREAAVGLVRLAAVLGRRGEALGEEWAELRRRAEEALGEADLDGWAALSRSLFGVDAARLLRAVDELVCVGAGAVEVRHLEALGRALGVRALEVRRRGATVARWGAEGAGTGEVAVAGVQVLIDGPVDGVVRAAAEVLAHVVVGGTAMPPAATGGAGGEILGASRAASTVREEIARWAPLPVTVLILGEPGTGKELVARELHRASGRKGAFVPVNCAGIPGSLLEAELFGVVRGAFTGADRDRQGLVEAAERGTLFLDEIGELPGELQAKLLRLLQEREVRRVGATAARAVDVRFVAATNRDLKAAAATGGFRQDLYYRLSVAVVEIPPLRERPDDVDELARHFLAHYAAAFGRAGVRLAPAALAVLRGGRWPGNVRELDSAIARAVAAAQPGETIGADRFPGLDPAPVSAVTLPSWTAAVEQFRRGYFTALLRLAGGNRSEAARRAGLSRQALLYHLRHLGKLDER